MMPFEQKVADVFNTLRTTEAGRSVDQFKSLPQANQFRKLYAIVAKHLRPGASVLDWGCGNGHFSFFLARQGFLVTAYSFETEPAVFSLLSDSERGRITFVRGSAEDPQSLPFPAQEFDSVCSIGVLEHVRETGGTENGSMSEIHRVLRAGGTFICYHLPNRYSYIEALNRFLYRSAEPRMQPGKYFHTYRFTQDDIRSLCQATGFALLELHRYGAIPRNVLRRLPGRLRDSRLLSTLVNAGDLLLEKALVPVSQSHSFIAVSRTGDPDLRTH
jgi:cyclopropane fatty-acyl-phospholipid synthase-like methyltransferase